MFERAGCGFSHVTGPRPPPSATQHRPELAGAPFEAMGVSLVFQPRNPYVPTVHMNVRMILATPVGGGDPVCWFGGGMDLTPYYGFEEDAQHFHRVCQQSLAPFGDDKYPRFKTWCDDYFCLKHRNEQRGVGGVFFDDFSELGFEQSFAMMRSVGSAFLRAYLPIVERRKDMPHGEREREFQLYRRGRYVEFNLVWDCAGMVRVQEVGPGIGAAYEEAAVLYANGNIGEAEAVIEAVLNDQNGSAGEGLWMMLLDLYRLDGRKDRFESRVLDYATRFERSPPPWVDLSQKVRRPRGDAMPLFNLAGALNAQVADQLRQMQVVGQKSGTLRIDLKRVRSFDENGCGLPLAMLKALRQERARYALLNGESLLEMIAGRVRVGEAQDRNSWLLLLELLQHSGDSERFESVALDYAITFEESPPSGISPIGH